MSQTIGSLHVISYRILIKNTGGSGGAEDKLEIISKIMPPLDRGWLGTLGTNQPLLRLWTIRQ